MDNNFDRDHIGPNLTINPNDRSEISLVATQLQQESNYILTRREAINRARAIVARPVEPWSWKSEPELMARLTKAQNQPKNEATDIMTIVGFFTSREQLEAHVKHAER